ncbi:MAG: hypothetical protein DI528_03300 [Shinella sp.]|nr:MAG: hypothetical protein DI528_03300 [Shinella sp.]
MKESLNETEKRRRRDDGVATRRLLLDQATRIFSEKGVGRTTSKEITAAAGTNTAAVNYYFGSIGKLYEELLVDAHDRLVSLDKLKAIASLDIPPQQRLTRLIEMVSTILLASPGEAASIRLLMREIFSPSPAFEVLRQRAILPKKRVMTNLVAETLGLPPGPYRRRPRHHRLRRPLPDASDRRKDRHSDAFPQSRPVTGRTAAIDPQHDHLHAGRAEGACR